jgi:hypothetical protein
MLSPSTTYQSLKAKILDLFSLFYFIGDSRIKKNNSNTITKFDNSDKETYEKKIQMMRIDGLI